MPPRSLYFSLGFAAGYYAHGNVKISDILSEFKNTHRTQFRPCIDLRNGKVTQIVGSTLESKSLKINFIGNQPASYYAELYKKNHLHGGHVIMLGSGNEKAAVAALKAYPGGLQVGGGINPGNAKEYIDAGASHVIVTSYIFSNDKVDLKRLENMMDTVGKHRLVIDLSCRKKDGKYYVVTDHWKTFTSFEITRENLEKLAEYCDEFLVHAVDVEGFQSGIVDELVEILAEISPIKVTYAGGARAITDLELVKKLSNGKVDVSIGSALDIFGGKLPYADVLTWNAQQKFPLPEIISAKIPEVINIIRKLIS